VLLCGLRLVLLSRSGRCASTCVLALSQTLLKWRSVENLWDFLCTVVRVENWDYGSASLLLASYRLISLSVFHHHVFIQRMSEHSCLDSNTMHIPFLVGVLEYKFSSYFRLAWFYFLCGGSAFGSVRVNPAVRGWEGIGFYGR